MAIQATSNGTRNSILQWFFRMLQVAGFELNVATFNAAVGEFRLAPIVSMHAEPHPAHANI